MATNLFTVEQAASHLSLHPKTILRYIRNGQLAATRVGKSYRITRDKLDAFTGVQSDGPETVLQARATCVVDIPVISKNDAERISVFLLSASLARDKNGLSMHVETAFDPNGRTMKIVVIGCPFDVSKMLDMLQIHLSSQS